MNNYQNQTPPPVLRNHHQHQQQQQQQLHHHNNHHFSTASAATSSTIPSTIQLTPSHHVQQHQHQLHHNNLHQNHNIMHHFTTPAAGGGAGSSLPPLPPTPQSLTATNTGSSSSASSSTVLTTNLQTPLQQQQQQPQPLISNSLAIRQEIQRFESVHPSIYAIYDLIDLLPITDAQIAQQIRDHVVCIEAITPETRGLILNSQAKKAVRNFLEQMPCGWPEYGIPPLAPYTNPDLQLHVAKSVVDALVQMLRFRFDGLENMEILKLKVSYTFNKKVKFHFNFKELKATASVVNTDAFLDTMKQLGLSVRYEGSGPLEFSLKNLSIQGQFKYKMPWIFGSIKIYKFQAVVTLGAVESNIGGILGNGKLNELINDQIEYLVPNFINGHQNEISAMIEETVVPTVNAKLKGKKIWYMLGQLGNSNKKCDAPPAPWLEEVEN